MDVGIIGGADGPTAIFIGGDPVGLILALFLAAGIVCGIILLFLRKRKK
ncbi:MAG: sodium ion-translocating decarboxylase subunit beta [Oscillospiraceae bacterium]|nr:sodium ion-translocating decarboxylase subunit beta [Oscillospiraceae bacterium]